MHESLDINRPTSISNKKKGVWMTLKYAMLTASSNVFSNNFNIHSYN